MKIAIAQLNPTIGDINCNAQKIIETSHTAYKEGAELLIAPELAICGYPPKDLLLRNDFLMAIKDALKKVSNAASLPIILGAPIKETAHLPYNAAVFCHNDDVKVIAKKRLLPNYNVFDEKRYFEPSHENACSTFLFNEKRLVISICEDAWSLFTGALEHRYAIDPVKNALIKHKADVLINLSASPFTKEKPHVREKLFTYYAHTYNVPVAVSGQVGANDQLLFDGHSMVLNNTGNIALRAKPFKEDLIYFNLENIPKKTKSAPLIKNDLIIKALKTGIYDYVTKCNAKGVIIGLSGGIDSALCATLASLALGKEKVRAVYLPSVFSSEESFNDAKALAKNLGIDFKTIDIKDMVTSAKNSLKDQMSKADPFHKDLTEQNLQARIRGFFIMALSNLNKELMIAPSNKSELAVGYTTIYGDMCGAFSPIGDLYKTEVYELSHHIHKKYNIFPSSILQKAPSAELKENQKDSDTLPDYKILDDILYRFIEEEKSKTLIKEETGYKKFLIDQVVTLISASEFKRRQGPFCLMVSKKVFGDARRLPIAKRFF